MEDAEEDDFEFFFHKDEGILNIDGKVKKSPKVSWLILVYDYINYILFLCYNFLLNTIKIFFSVSELLKGVPQIKYEDFWQNRMDETSGASIYHVLFPYVHCP